MADHGAKLTIDPNLTAFPAATLRRALKHCDTATTRRLTQSQPSGWLDVVTIAAAQVKTHDGRHMTITPEQLYDPQAGIGDMTRLADSVVLDIVRRAAPASQTPVPVNADLLMFGWPGNEVVIPIAGSWTSDDTLLLADTIREAALLYADGDPFWKAESHEYACRTKALSELLLADEFQAFLYRLENAVALFNPLRPSPQHQVNSLSHGYAITCHPRGNRPQ